MCRPIHATLRFAAWPIVILVMTDARLNGSAQAQAQRGCTSRRGTEGRRPDRDPLRRIRIARRRPAAARPSSKSCATRSGICACRLRRGQKIEEREYRLVESRLLGVREAVRRLDIGAHGRGEVPPAPAITIGTELHLRLPDRLDAPTPGKEIWFDAVTTTELADGTGDDSRRLGDSWIAAPSRWQSRTDGRAGLVVTLREITVHGRTYVGGLPGDGGEDRGRRRTRDRIRRERLDPHRRRRRRWTWCAERYSRCASSPRSS